MSDGTDVDQKDEIYDWQTKQNEHPTSDRSSIAGDILPLNRGSNLPIARIKKIMKEGEHPGMIAADAPVLLAKACEMLIKDLTLQSWDCTLTTRRCTLQRQDVAAAIFKNSCYNFMLDIFTPEELYPKLEPKVGNIIQFNPMKHMKDARSYPFMHGLNNPRDGYMHGNLPMGQGHIPMGHAEMYHRGMQRYLLNPAAQGHVMGSHNLHVVPFHGIPALNNMMPYPKNMPMNGHMMHSAPLTKLPMPLLPHCTKSQPITQGTAGFTEGEVQNQATQSAESQMLYMQRYPAPPERDSTQTYHPPY
ncbi:histone-like transcription factor protein [Babesia ovis]|uniref:Histone-like transcription factor protein n=1 Tax=Babesia ovis TaxID=5869 RepID=A0A9W5WWK5_BABOV|nr:histone-like transcription factor protein [Babesia ovis]